MSDVRIKSSAEKSFNFLVLSINNTIYITPVPAGSGFGDVFKIIIGITLMIFAPTIAAAIAAYVPFGVATIGAVGLQAGVAATWLVYSIAAIGGLLALKGLTDYLTPQTPGNSPDSYLFGNAQENVKMGSPVPLLYGELIVPGVTINYSMRDQKTTGYNSSFTYVSSTSNSPANSGGDSNKSLTIVHQK